MMRCRYCGSTSIHSATEHKNFSTGKALAGTIAFGPLGAGAGMLGKEINGFRCTRCGSFMERPMDTLTEKMVNDAIYSARNKQSFASYNYYKSQYPNIETVEVQNETQSERVSVHITENLGKAGEVKISEEKPVEKRAYDYNIWDPSCPVYIRRIIIKKGTFGDGISFDIVNQSRKTIRSLYLQVTVLDDTRDIITSLQCVYQGENVEPGKTFPEQTMFKIGSDLAYHAEVICEKVSFTDNSVWRTEEGAEALKIHAPEKINRQEFPRLGYLGGAYYGLLQKHCVVEKNDWVTGRPHLKILPEERKNEGYWLCTCGMPVKTGQACPVCRCTLEELQEIFSQQYLIDRQHEAVLTRAAERAKETSEFRENVVRKEEEKKAEQYEKALSVASSDSISDLTDAVKLLDQLGNYKEAESKRAEYCSRINAFKAEEERKQKELEEKKREEQNKKLLEEEKVRKRRTKWLILAAAALIAVLVFSFVRHYFDPYQKVHRYILENGKHDSDERFIKVEDDDLLFGAYTMSLIASDKDRRPFWIEITYYDTAKNSCKGEVEFSPSSVSFDVEADYYKLPLINDSGHHIHSGEAILYGSVDLSHLKNDDWYKYIEIHGVSQRDSYEYYDYDGLKGTSPEGEPEIQNTLAEAVFLSLRSLEKALKDNNINVTMDDLGLISLNQTSGFSESQNKAKDNDASAEDAEGSQQSSSAYEVCKENILSTGSKRSDDFFNGYEYVLPVEPGTTDYLQSSIAVVENSDHLFVLFEFNGTAPDFTGMRWKLELDGEQGRYELHQPYKVDGKKEFVTLKGSFNLATYSPDTTYTADEVIPQEEAILDVSAIEEMKTTPTNLIISSVSSLYYWLDKSGINVTVEDLGFG